MSSADSYPKPVIQASDIIHVERFDENIFRGQSLIFTFNEIYGGQFLGHALNAASHTVDKYFVVQSFHCYFVRHAFPKRDIIYQVARYHDEKSFAKRSVRGIQKGKVVFNMIASFVLSGYLKGYDVQIAAVPNVPPPENFENTEQLRLKLLSKVKPPMLEQLSELTNVPSFLDIRPVDKKVWFTRGQLKSGRILGWMKLKQTLGKDQLHMHTCMLAYISDIWTIHSIIIPYPTKLHYRLEALSIDHSIWVHRSFRCDEWLLGVFRTTVSYGGKGLSHVELYQNGCLVATCAQEGLARMMQTKPKSEDFSARL